MKGIEAAKTFFKKKKRVVQRTTTRTEWAGTRRY
jgi:hypothetical protein